MTAALHRIGVHIQLPGHLQTLYSGHSSEQMTHSYDCVIILQEALAAHGFQHIVEQMNSISPDFAKELDLEKDEDDTCEGLEHSQVFEVSGALVMCPRMHAMCFTGLAKACDCVPRGPLCAI